MNCRHPVTSNKFDGVERCRSTPNPQDVPTSLTTAACLEIKTEQLRCDSSGNNLWTHAMTAQPAEPVKFVQLAFPTNKLRGNRPE